MVEEPEETVVNVLPVGSSTPETNARSHGRKAVASVLIVAALVAAFMGGRVTAASTAAVPETTLEMTGKTALELRNNNGQDIRSSLPQELSKIWAAIEGLQADVGTQTTAFINQLNQESADREAALTQLNVSMQTSVANIEDAVTTTSANLTAELQLEASSRAQAVAAASTELQNNIDSLGTSINADLSDEAASREVSDSRLENILACRPGLVRDPNDDSKCMPCAENQFWSAISGGCSDCPAHSTATPGSTSCTCDSGFAETTDGQCEDVNECLDNLCGDDAVCTNTEGSFTCQCNFGSVMEDGVCISGAISSMEGTLRALTNRGQHGGRVLNAITRDEAGTLFYTQTQTFSSREGTAIAKIIVRSLAPLTAC
mmetsp:Transcript_9479/g.22001  ORF Transcript_9479/g.22001 Transcript_9479/m.22001 type:complete len:374 (-) Transcript_9479:1170-2291(-)